MVRFLILFLATLLLLLPQRSMFGIAAAPVRHAIDQVAESDAPAISHAPVRNLQPDENLVVEATVIGPRPIARVSLAYRVGDRFGDVPLERSGTESEIWLADAANSRVHIFDATIMPPKQVASIRLRDQPGWVTFSLDGRYAYPSTGDVIDVRTKQIVAGLTDERGRAVQSEKMVDVVYSDGRMTRVGDQFGVGRKR